MAAAIIASVPAGPLFVGIAILSNYVASVPAIVPFSLGFALVAIPVLFLSLLGGVVLAFFPILIGAHLMSAAGEFSETARDTMAWAIVGGLSGAGIAALTAGFDEGAPFAVALILTSAICALICRSQFRWDGQG
ncbi:MAG: hypothetical protein KF780_08770 [Sphingomonas sp.]|nr:hypothetical protein [Sphingomonas sp.]